MTKQRHCYVTDVGDAIEKMADALDPQREPPFKGDILDLLEWAAKDVLAMRAEIATMKAEKFEAGNNQTIFMVRISELLQQLAAKDVEIERLKTVPMKYRRMAFNAQLQDENESLRQQLAAMAAAYVEATEHAGLNQQLETAPRLAEHKQEIESLRQQLAERETQVTLLRGLLLRYRTETPPAHSPHMICHEVDAALADTTDLDGLILCDAEPVHHIYEYPYWDGSVVWRDTPSFNGVDARKSIPLYRAKEQGK